MYLLQNTKTCQLLDIHNEVAVLFKSKLSGQNGNIVQYCNPMVRYIELLLLY